MDEPDCMHCGLPVADCGPGEGCPGLGNGRPCEAGETRPRARGGLARICPGCRSLDGVHTFDSTCTLMDDDAG